MVFIRTIVSLVLILAIALVLVSIGSIVAKIIGLVLFLAILIICWALLS